MDHQRKPDVLTLPILPGPSEYADCRAPGDRPDCAVLRYCATRWGSPDAADNTRQGGCGQHQQRKKRCPQAFQLGSYPRPEQQGWVVTFRRGISRRSYILHPGKRSSDSACSWRKRL